MIIDLFKLLFSFSAAFASVYSMNTVGPGMWSFIFIGIAILVLVSVFVKKINVLAVILARVSGVLATLSLLLLLLAATFNGSFSLSESNEIFAVLLFVLSVFGLSAFFWPIRKKGERT